MDIDQFALATLTEEGVPAFLGTAQAAFQRTLRPGRLVCGNPDPYLRDSHKVYYGIFIP
jgi:hypothetical protein